jgi:hypothetical protein
MFSSNLHPPALCCLRRIMGSAYFDCKQIGCITSLH